MTGPDLRDALLGLGLTKAEFSRWCGVKWKTVHRWCTGELDVPPYAETIIGQEREIRVLRLRCQSPRR